MMVRLLIILLLAAGVFATRADEYDDLRLKWRDIIVGTGYDAADPQVASRLASIAGTANTHWTSMDPSPTRSFLWSDLASTTISAHVSSTYGRLHAMALAYATPGCSLQGNASLLADLTSALDWMHSNRYGAATAQYDNWWDWEIGTPLFLTDIGVLIYHQLTATQRSNYMNAVEHQTPLPDMTHANKVWKTRVVGVRGCLVKSSAKLLLARDAFSAVFPYVTSNDGFYTDGSFIQHSYHPYTAGYGASLLANMVPVISWLSGSTWAVTDPAKNNLYQWVFQAFEPVIYRGAPWDLVRGRGITSSSAAQANGHSIMDSILQLAQFAPPADAARMKSMVKYWAQNDPVRDFISNRPLPTLTLAKQLMADATVAPRGELIGHYTFPQSDRVVHLRPGYGFGLSMCSSRIANFESINGQNLQGWFTGDGRTVIQDADLNQHNDAYWATVDPYRLPGITADTTHQKLPAVAAAIGPRAQGQSTRSPHNWVGGATLGNFGSAGMQLRGWGVTLTGKKSWFMFDDEIVCLGAAINSSDSRPIETIVDNRRLNTNGDNPFAVDGTAKPAALGWSEAMTGVKWAHLAGSVNGADIGYYFPQPATLKAVREARTGSWADVNSGSSTAPITRNYLRLGFEHGSNPNNANYQYVILPGRSARRSGHYAETPQVTVIANDTNVQAVSETTLGITAANFWNDSLRSAGIITVDKKASVLVRNDGTFIDVSISDPTQANTGSINLQIAASANTLISADSGINVTQLQPGIAMSVNVSGSKGKTFRARFYLGTPETIDLTPVADAYAYDGAVDTNYGTLATLAVKKASAGNNRISYLRFEVPAWNGALVGATLKLTPGADTSSPGLHGVAKVADNSWVESGSGGLTWSNKPAVSGALLATWTPVASTRLSANVRDAITGAGPLSLCVYSTLNNDGWVAYASRENGTATIRPQLSLAIGHTPPAVELTTPADGDIITHAAEISIVADVQPTDGAITRVSFFDGEILLGTDTTAPYAITANLGGGPHHLTAVATDSHGLTKTSLSRRIDVAYPPVATTASRSILQNTVTDVDLRSLASDVETPATRLRFSVGTASHGNVVLMPDGHTARFTPASNYSGPASFSYTVTDATADDRTFLNYDFQASDATDVSGRGRDGSLNLQGTGTATFTADLPPPLSPQHTQSLRLTDNGTAGAARVDRAVPSFEFNFNTADWTISGWFKRAGTTNIDSVLQLGESGGWGNNALTLVLNSGNNTLELRNFAATVQDVGLSKSNVAAGTWHHYAVVRNGSTISLYLNGSLVGSDSAFTFTFDLSKPVKFGGVASSTLDRWFNGSMADPAIFGAALTAAEITRLGTLPTANFSGQSASAAVNFSILHPPVANSGNLATSQDTPADIDLRSLASDVETPAGQLLFTVGSATNGTVVLLADGHTARFTPAPGHTGPASFTYTVTDTRADSRTFLNYHFQSGDAADSSGQGRDGSVNLQGTGAVSFNPDAPAAIAPQQPQSLFLTENGTQGAARVERSISSSDLDLINSDWTIAGWFKRTNTGTIDSILQLGESGGWGNNSLSLVLPAGSTSIELRNFAGTVQDVDITKTGLATAAWHHFAIVRNGTTLSLYLNGTAAGSDSDFSFSFDPAKPLKLGGVSTATSVWDRWHHGGLADFGVFSAALNASEITRLATGPTANLTGQARSNTVSLTVNPPASTPYETWMATRYPGLTAADQLPAADPDRDGSSNLLEFALNGNPTDAAANGWIASLIQNSSAPASEELTLVIAVRDGALFSPGANGVQSAAVAGITYTVEGSLDSVFPAAPVSSTGPSATAPAATGLPDLSGTAWKYHTFKLDASEGLTGKGFLRLKVTQP
jgi:hyaluronate lyase